MNKTSKKRERLTKPSTHRLVPKRLAPAPRQSQTLARPEPETSPPWNWTHANFADEPIERRSPLPRLVSESVDSGVQPLRILVADDQLLIRAGICALVKALPNVEIVGEANDGRAALRLIEARHPDIVLMDIAMPGMNGLEALALAKGLYPQVKIIILSEHSNEEFVFRALRSGAAGFVVKDDPVTQLYAAIKAVAGGGEHLSPQVTRKIVFGYLESQRNAAPKPPELTSRERQILQHIAEGKSTKEIAGSLAISLNTVKSHRLNLMDKLGVHEISGVVRYASKIGLIKRKEAS